MHVVSNSELEDAAVLVCRNEIPVLVLREGLLSPTDFDLVRSLLSCVVATAAPATAEDEGLGLRYG